MSSGGDWNALSAAAARYGPMIDAYTRKRYGLSGETVLLKLTKGESGGRGGAVSSAGARGWTQFMPATRADYVKRYGVDPWKSPDQAIHATALYLKNSGGDLQAYNPGMPTYTKYILGQDITGLPRSSAGSGGASASASSASGTVATPGATATATTERTVESLPALDLSGILASSRRTPIQSSALPAPSFAAGPAMPQGYQTLSSSGAPTGGRASALRDLLTEAASAPQAMTTQASSTSRVPGSVLKTSGGSSSGAVDSAVATGKLSPHARAGDPVVSSKQSEGGAHATAGLAGYPAHDFFAPAGTHAVAPVSGTVIKNSGHDPSLGAVQGAGGPLGWSTYIKGNDGKTYFLTHLGSRNVKVGQKVKQGQIIGTVANYDKYGRQSHIHMGVSG